MSSFVIAGKADDPSFARAEYAARQVQAIVPNTYVRLEMKHPDHWKSFLASVCRMYDFANYSDDFSGPLVWTLEGDLIGGGADFVQKICLEKFGIQDPPAVTDSIFKDIAADNLKQVKLLLQREQHGPPLAERCAAAHRSAKELDLFRPQPLVEQKKIFSSGATIEVWQHPKLLEEAQGDGASQRLDVRLRIGKIGQEESHLALLHPEPLVPKHMVLVPSRFVEEVTEAQLQQEAAPPAPPAPEAEAQVEVPPPEAAEDTQQQEEEPAVPQPPSEVVQLSVPPHRIRSDPQEDISLADFTAAMELLTQVGGVATWSAICSGTEFRPPLETHLQVLPFPLGGKGHNLRFPLEFLIERCVREKEKEVETLPIFPFQHVLVPIPAPATTDSSKASPADFAKSASSTYDTALVKLSGVRQGASRLLAFTTSWMLVVDLIPPEPGTPEHEVWLKLPPPHPCALCGFVICPPVERGFPETAGGILNNGRLVSSRAEEEGIATDAPDYEQARKEVRISTQIYARPAETLGLWAKK